MVSYRIMPVDEQYRKMYIKARSPHAAMLWRFPSTGPSEHFHCLSVDDGGYEFKYSTPIGIVYVHIVHQGRRLGNNPEDCAIIKAELELDGMIPTLDNSNTRRIT